MNGNVRVYPPLNSVFGPFRSQQDSPLLSIGIIDDATEERLYAVLDWYTSHMDYDIHVLTTLGRFDVENLMRRYPSVTCLVFMTSGFSGERINQFAYGCRSRFFFITHCGADLIYFDSAKVGEVMAGKEHPAMVVPLRLNSKGECTPDIRIPLLTKEGEIDVACDMPDANATRFSSLYPIMGRGWYDTALFQRLRGYDEQIHSEYWQALDWGIRCWMMGHPIYLSTFLVEFYPAMLSLVEDQSARAGWERCLTKALGVKVTHGKVELVKPKRHFDRDAWRGEVKPRLRYQVKRSYPTLVESWGVR